MTTPISSFSLSTGHPSSLTWLLGWRAGGDQDWDVVGVPLLHRLRDGQAGYDGEDDVGDWRDVSSEAFIVVFGARLVVIGIHCVTSPGGTGPWS